MKKFNIEEFFTFIVLLGFSSFMFYLLATEKIYDFISPKMVIYMIFALVILTLLTLYQGNKIFSPKNNRPISNSHIILLLTLLVGFMAAERGVNSSIITNKGVNLPNYEESSKLKPSEVSSGQGKDEKHGFEEKGNKRDLQEKDGAITIDEENYYKAVNEIGTNLDKYVGKNIIISGFVHKKKEYKEDEFVLGRMTMACCVADAQVIGVMAKYPETSKLEKDSWVKLEGILDKGHFIDFDTKAKLILPVIKVSKAEEIEKPKNIYVYPE